ncbi:MAG: hypothetical protein ABI579_07470 [Candidatus Sumerlaeota bacterium]
METIQEMNTPPTPPSTDGEIVVSFPYSDEILKGACQAARIKKAGKFGHLGFRIIGTIFLVFAFFFLISPHDGSNIMPVLIWLFCGSYLIAIPSIQWIWAYKKNRNYFTRAGVKDFNYRFGKEKIISTASDSYSQFPYHNLTLIIPHKNFMLLFVHNVFFFIPRDAVSPSNFDIILDRFRNAGVKVRA